VADTKEITVMLNEMKADPGASPAELLEIVYADLRKLAVAYMRNERSDHTLQPTALVHEAYMRLVDWKNVSWQSRAHFFSLAAEVMRKVLIDHARSHKAKKRSGQKVVLDDAISIPSKKPIDMVALDDAMKALESLDPRQAKIVELRFFGGLTIEETAYVLDISEATVRREWTFSKAWFQRELAN
jgi:RNA polymerase sigma factor (TIGR02999 family)